MRHVVGIDGGGTRTRIVLVNEAGQELGRGSAGPGNLLEVGRRGLTDTVAEAWKAAWRDAGHPPERAAAVHAGLAGVATQGERDEARSAIVAAGLAEQDVVGVSADLETAHAGALAGGQGIVVLAGTGSAAFGRDANGATARAAGMGPLFDDPGSAYDLGRRALIAAARATDGRGPETALTHSLLEAFDVPDLRSIARRHARGDLSRSGVAALAPLVSRAAEEGDREARAILAWAADELAEAARAVAERLTLGHATIAAIGGLVEGSRPFRSRLEEALRRRLPHARLQAPVMSAVRGAALRALEQLTGAPISEKLLAALRKGP